MTCLCMFICVFVCMRVIAYLMRFSMHLCVNPLYVFFGFVPVQCVYFVPLKADDKNRNTVKKFSSEAPLQGETQFSYLSFNFLSLPALHLLTLELPRSGNTRAGQRSRQPQFAWKRNRQPVFIYDSRKRICIGGTTIYPFLQDTQQIELSDSVEQRTTYGYLEVNHMRWITQTHYTD